jgi:asparagine N-glycosylation enzyme membrane subunit Stt3
VVVLTVSLISSVLIQNAGVKTNTIIDNNVDATPGPTNDSEIEEIQYTDKNGTVHVGDLFKDSKDTFNWIKNNTPEDSVFLCWFDYGHSILGYAERDVVVKNPSQESLEVMQYLKGAPVEEFESQDKFLDVCKALIATDSTETIQLMQKYNAEYIFVHDNDPQKMVWPATVLGLDAIEYSICQESDGTMVPSEKLSQTILYQLSQDGATGFDLVYQGQAAKVYKIA